MEHADVVVIGGSAAGLAAAMTARRHYPEKSVLVLRREKKVLIPCGIPYIFGTLGSPDKNLIPDSILEKNGIGLRVGEVTRIDRAGHVVETEHGPVRYERLVVATGSRPEKPPIPGLDLDGVFAIVKDIPFLERLQQHLAQARNVVVIGGGFIGIEFADEMKKAGANSVTVVECARHCLSLSYDAEFCQRMESHLESRGVTVRTGRRVLEVLGDPKVRSVRLDDGSELPADLVVVGIGAAANVDLARVAGLALGPTGGILVDRTMKTSDPQVFAAGDCAEKTSFLGGQPSALRLASIACSEGRVAGANLFVTRREQAGTVGAWCTAVGDLALGTAGLTEDAAVRRGFDVATASVEGVTRHPGGMPGAGPQKVKMVFDRRTGRVLGGQVMGDAVTGEVTNVIAACIQGGMTAEDLAVFQIATHPALTASPLVYALNNVAEQALCGMAAARKAQQTQASPEGVLPA